jgi:hypothetical protein
MAFTATQARAQQEVITNGGFETCDLTGWTSTVFPGSAGSILATSTTTGPFSGLPQIGPRSGSCYVLTDMTGGGAYALTQSFSLSAPASSAQLSFGLSLTDWSRLGPIFGLGFDPYAAANQWASADLFFGTLSDGFSTATPLQNFFAGTVIESAGPNPYAYLTFNITSLLNAAGTYTLRFAEVDNQLFHNMAVDDVSLLVSTVPEPATVGLLAIGLAAVGGAGAIRLRRQRS